MDKLSIHPKYSPGLDPEESSPPGCRPTEKAVSLPNQTLGGIPENPREVLAPEEIALPEASPACHQPPVTISVGTPLCPYGIAFRRA